MHVGVQSLGTSQVGAVFSLQFHMKILEFSCGCHSMLPFLKLIRIYRSKTSTLNADLPQSHLQKKGKLYVLVLSGCRWRE